MSLREQPSIPTMLHVRDYPCQPGYDGTLKLQAHSAAYVNVQEAVGDDLDRRYTLCLLLLLEKARGTESYWAAYIAALPTSYSKPPLLNPSCLQSTAPDHRKQSRTWDCTAGHQPRKTRLLVLCRSACVRCCFLLNTALCWAGDPLWWGPEAVSLLEGTKLEAGVEYQKSTMKKLRLWRRQLYDLQAELGGPNTLQVGTSHVHLEFKHVPLCSNSGHLTGYVPSIGRPDNALFLSWCMPGVSLSVHEVTSPLILDVLATLCHFLDVSWDGTPSALSALLISQTIDTCVAFCCAEFRRLHTGWGWRLGDD